MKKLARSFCFSHIQDIVSIFISILFLHDLWIYNESSEYQGFFNLEYFILLTIALKYYSCKVMLNVNQWYLY